MLGKLIKYEFRASGRLIPLVYLVVAILLVAGAVFAATRWYVYFSISFILLFLAGAAAMIITYVIIFIRFYRGMYGAEGYLAMTLPVTTTQLYLSKTIASFVWMVLSSVVTFFAWMASFVVLFGVIIAESSVDMTGAEWNNIWYEFRTDIWPELSRFFSDFMPPGITLFFIFISIVSCLSFLAQVYFCITLGNIRPFQKMGIAAAIIAYILLQIVNQIFSSILTWAAPLTMTYSMYEGWALTNHSFLDIMRQSAYSSMDIPIPVASYILPILYAFVLPIFTIMLMNRKVNVK